MSWCNGFLIEGTIVTVAVLAAWQAHAQSAPAAQRPAAETKPTAGSLQPEFLLGKTCREVDASALMWEFFAQYRLAEEGGGK